MKLQINTTGQTTIETADFPMVDSHMIYVLAGASLFAIIIICLSCFCFLRWIYIRMEKREAAVTTSRWHRRRRCNFGETDIVRQEFSALERTQKRGKRSRSRSKTSPAVTIQPNDRSYQGMHRSDQSPEIAPYDELLNQYEEPGESSIPPQVHSRPCDAAGASGVIGKTAVNFGDGVPKLGARAHCDHIGKANAVCGGGSVDSGRDMAADVGATDRAIGASRGVLNYKTVTKDGGIVDGAGKTLPRLDGRCNHGIGSASTTPPSIPHEPSNRSSFKLDPASKIPGQFQCKTETAVVKCIVTTPSSSKPIQRGDKDMDPVVGNYENTISKLQTKIDDLVVEIPTGISVPATKFTNDLEKCLKSRPRPDITAPAVKNEMGSDPSLSHDTKLLTSIEKPKTGTGIDVPGFKYEKGRHPPTPLDINPSRSSPKLKTDSDIPVPVVEHDATGNHPVKNNAKTLGASPNTKSSGMPNVPAVKQKKKVGPQTHKKPI